MSATVRFCGNDAVRCIGQISELGNHGTPGAGLGRGDEGSRELPTLYDGISERSCRDGDVEVFGRRGRFGQ